MAAKFTWIEKFTRVLEKVPEDTRGDFALAIISYGTDGIEPDIEFPYDAIFESIREDIDYSIKARSIGSMGGRPSTKKTAKPRENDKNNDGLDEKIGGLKEDETPLKTPLSESLNHTCEDAKPIAVHSIASITSNKSLSPIPPSDDSTEAVRFALDAIGIFNEITGKSVREPEGEVMLRLQRIHDRGYSLDDIRKVVKAKNRQWKSDRKMKAYIRPETIFGPKFDSYLNENEVIDDGGFDEHPVRHIG